MQKFTAFFCRRMGYLTVFGNEVVTSVAKGRFRKMCLEVEILGGRVWRTKKSPEK